jgi:O-methyltransferase
VALDYNYLVEWIKPYTKTSPERIRGWIDALQCIDRDNIPGDIVECGVWRGGNIILARLLSPARMCWLYDTFTGMTKPGPKDTKKGGSPALQRYVDYKEAGTTWAAASVEEVRQGFEYNGVLDDKFLNFVEGDVCKTLKFPPVAPERISLLRLDTDWYESTKMELEVLYPRLVPGGVLIVDDYGHWMGSRKAVDEYFGAGINLAMLDYTACKIVKPC